MPRAEILICPSCDYKRRLTEAESIISYALVVACLKCGTAMQCTSKINGKSSQKHGSPAPVAVLVQGQKMVEKVVPMRDAAEHVAHPQGRLFFAGNARRRGSTAHGPAGSLKAISVASSTLAPSMPEVTVTSPMRTGRTK